MNKFVFILVLLFNTLAVSAQEQVMTGNPSLTNYLKLAEQNKNAGDVKEATRWLNEAATLLWEEKKYTEAIGYFNQSIELNNQINNESGISKIQSNLGMIYADMQQYNESLEHFKQSLVYREKANNKAEIISCRINMAVVLNNLKRYTEAATNLETALELATEMNDAAQMKSVYGMLAETYEKAGNQERTTHYFNLYRTFHEMLTDKKVTAAKKETENARLQALQAELDKKEKELELFKTTKVLDQTEQQLNEVSVEAKSLIENNTKQQLAMSLLEREAELNKFRIQQAENSQLRQQSIMMMIGIALTASLAFALNLYRNNKNKKQLIARLAEQNEEIKTLNESLSRLPEKAIMSHNV